MYSTADLIILAKAYLALSGCAESTLSVHAFGNDKTLPRLLAGFDCTARTVERASTWFDSNWPLGLAWPREVVRRRDELRPRLRAARTAPANGMVRHPR
jgi:hypothetical protein